MFLIRDNASFYVIIVKIRVYFFVSDVFVALIHVV